MRLHRNERKRESRKRRGKCFKKNVAVQFEMKKQKKKRTKNGTHWAWTNVVEKRKDRMECASLRISLRKLPHA